MDLGLIAQAAGMFAVTNIDDILLLALFFGMAAGRRSTEIRIVVGQYLGFGIILLVSVIGALGARLLSEELLPYLGLIPLALGIRAAIHAWRHRKDPDDAEDPDAASAAAPTGRLLGAQLVGRLGTETAKRVDTYATALFAGLTVAQISDLDLSYTPPLGSPWDAVQVATQTWSRARAAATVNA